MHCLYVIILLQEYESSQLSWEQREAQLEKQLEAWSKSSGGSKTDLLVNSQVSVRICMIKKFRLCK